MSDKRVILDELRKDVSTAVPEQIGPIEKISREDALIEAEYMFRQALKEEPKSESFEEGFGGIIEDIFRYLQRVGHADITKDELLEVILKDLR